MKKHYKMIINLSIWHLKPYKHTSKVSGIDVREYGFLCFKYVITQ